MPKHKLINRICTVCQRNFLCRKTDYERKMGHCCSRRCSGRLRWLMSAGGQNHEPRTHPMQDSSSL